MANNKEIDNKDTKIEKKQKKYTIDHETKYALAGYTIGGASVGYIYGRIFTPDNILEPIIVCSGVGISYGLIKMFKREQKTQQIIDEKGNTTTVVRGNFKQQSNSSGLLKTIIGGIIMWKIIPSVLAGGIILGICRFVK